jgi:hypothetical protein
VSGTKGRRRADEAFAAQIADASAPFCQHAREALAERHP